MMVGAVSLVVIVILSWARTSTRLNLRAIYEAIINGARGAAEVAIPSAVAGIIVGVLIQSGMALHLERWLLDLAGNSLMISLIGGRLVPSFTRNWMSKQGITQRLPNQPGRYDLATLAATALALAAWTIAPNSRPAGLALALAGALQAVRLLRWSGWRTGRDPLVLILHVAYAWIPLGLVLLASSILGTAVPRTAAIHALTAGAMATMILAVTTRASLGHTGRLIRAPRSATIAFVLVTAAAIVRVGAPILVPSSYLPALGLTAALWGLAFAIYAVAYAPLLFAPRVDGKSG
jgi:uncharacterized protein involved in response to NO